MDTRAISLLTFLIACFTAFASAEAQVPEVKYRFPQLNFTDYSSDVYNETKLNAIHEIVQHAYAEGTVFVKAEDIPEELQPIQITEERYNEIFFGEKAP